MATAFAQTVPRAAAVRAVRPQQMRSNPQPLEVDEISFGAFGSWSSEDLFLSGAKNHWELARWMALNEVFTKDTERLWQLCIAANQKGFKRYRAMDLYDKSLNLKAGKVVFEYIEEPTHIPDNPPEVIIRRMLKAILAHRESKLYCLEPVFKVADDVSPTLALLSDLREQVEAERQAVFALYFRHRRMVQAWNWLNWKLKGFEQSMGAWLEREALKAELRKVQRSKVRVYQGYSFEAEVTRRNDLAERALKVGLKEEARSFTASVTSLRKIDPILSFTLPERPNLHRFIGHWFWGIDRQTRQPRVYVHV